MTLRNRIVGDNHVKDFESNLINELNNDERYQLIFQKQTHIARKYSVVRSI